MVLSRFILIVFLIFPPSLFAAFPIEISGHILYLLHRGEAKQAFINYLDYAREKNAHDFALLQQAGVQLLEQGIESNDAEIQLMCMFGAGVANSKELLHILEKGIHLSDQRTQLIALNYLSKQQDDLADQLLIEALSSPFLLTRLEGCFQLAQKNHPAVLTHLQSLMVKVPDLVRALFPQIVVQLDGASAYNYLRQLLTDTSMEVRIEAILAIAKQKRDDFLVQIRNLASDAHHSEQEACAFALGELKDSKSLPRLAQLAKSPRKEVQLASMISLFKLGERSYLKHIENEAKAGNLFAIYTLGVLKEGKEVLQQLIHHSDRDVRLNATISLLELRIKGPVEEILFSKKSDLGFTRLSSPGQCLKAWKIIPSHRHHTKAYPGSRQQTISLREKVLIQCLELPEEQFLQIAQHLIDQKQTELIPLLVSLLENMRTTDATQLLKQGAQKAGEPLIRNFCTLALYRLQEKGPYEQQLIHLVKQRADKTMIQFQEEEKTDSLSVAHELRPEETSQLLVEIFETLAQAQNQTGVEALVHAMAYGNPKNRYALAGLLIRTTE